MKRIGMLGAVVAAFVLSAGTDSAPGAILCDTNSAGCTAGTPYPVPTTLNGALVPKILAEFDTVSYGTIKCETGVMEVETTAGAFEAKVQVLKFAKCKPCTNVTAIVLPWTSTSFLSLGGGNGRMQSIGTFLNFEAFGCNVKGQPTTCKFGSEAIRLEIEGGSPAIFEGGAGTGFEPNPCGASEWRAALEIISPQPLNVT
jgi:hypothetical protein